MPPCPAAVVVSKQEFEILASILNDFGEKPVAFTFEDFAKAMKTLGFARRGDSSLIPPKRFGNKVMHIPKAGGSKRGFIDLETQERWKLLLFRLYGWTAETFRAPKVRRQESS